MASDRTNRPPPKRNYAIRLKISHAARDLIEYIHLVSLAHTLCQGNFFGRWVLSVYLPMCTSQTPLRPTRGSGGYMETKYSSPRQTCWFSVMQTVQTIDNVSAQGNGNGKLLVHSEATVPHVKVVCVLPQVAAHSFHFLGQNCSSFFMSNLKPPPT